MFVFLMPHCKLIEIKNELLGTNFGSLLSYISKNHRLSLEDLILLTDGGIQLRELDLIADHCADENDTHPVYVFSRVDKVSPESVSYSALTVPEKTLQSLEYDVKASSSSTSSLGLTVKWLLTSMKDVMEAVEKSMEVLRKLAQDQQLMCQGWFVARANFEHDLENYKQTLEGDWRNYEGYCAQVSHWEDNFKRFPALKERLKSVPILPSLQPIIADLGSDSVNVYGPPRTLYDWLCLQMLHALPSFRGSRGSWGSFGIPNPAVSCADLSGSPINTATPCGSGNRRPRSSIFTANASFYLSTPPEGDTPAVPSLESALVEHVDEMWSHLKNLQEHTSQPVLHRQPPQRDLDESSLFLAPIDDEEVVEEPQQETAVEEEEEVPPPPQLSAVHGFLKEFAESLDSAPRDPETPSPPRNPTNFVPMATSTPKAEKEPLKMSSTSMLTSDYWPIPEELEEEEEGDEMTAVTADSGNLLNRGIVCTSSSEEMDLSPDPRPRHWRVSWSNFASHLEKVAKLRSEAEETATSLQNVASGVVKTIKEVNGKTQLRNLLGRQRGPSCQVSHLYRRFQELFSKSVELKADLATALTQLQEQLSMVASGLASKHRNCMRAFKFLREISRCSAILDQMHQTPDLYLNCLIEIVRRRRLTSLVSSIQSGYNQCLLDFHTTEAQRRDALSRSLKGHLLADIFRPLCCVPVTTTTTAAAAAAAPTMTGGLSSLRLQPSRVSFASVTSSSSCSTTRHLARTNKCLSTSQLNNHNTASAFRLPGNRPTRPPPETASETEVRDLVAKLPPDLSERVSRALNEIEAEAERISEDFAMIGGGGGMGMRRKSSTAYQRRRSRVLSSSCGGGGGGIVDVSTSTSEQLAAIQEGVGSKKTEEKAVEVCMEVNESPPTASPAVASHTSQCQTSISASSDVFLSVIDSSQLLDEDSHSHQKNGNATPTGSVIASTDPQTTALLAAQAEALKNLVQKLGIHLSAAFDVSPPAFNASEETTDGYLGATLDCLQKLIAHLDRNAPPTPTGNQRGSSKTGKPSPTSSSSSSSGSSSSSFVLTATSASSPSSANVSTVSTQTGVVETRSASILCHIEDVHLQQPVSPRNLSIPHGLQNCAFSNFRPEDVVIFIPMVVDRHQLQQSIDNPTGSTNQETMVPSDQTEASGIAFWGSRSLALLSSAIISSSLAPESPSQQRQTSSGSQTEQWRMLSKDGFVYFLHDDDFAAFQVARAAKVFATSAPGRGNTGSSQPTVGNQDDKILPLSQRAQPFVLGVFQRMEKCISKKSENRFNLPREFVFFRVRARPLL